MQRNAAHWAWHGFCTHELMASGLPIADEATQILRKEKRGALYALPLNEELLTVDGYWGGAAFSPESIPLMIPMLQ